MTLNITKETKQVFIFLIIVYLVLYTCCIMSSYKTRDDKVKEYYRESSSFYINDIKIFDIKDGIPITANDSIKIIKIMYNIHTDKLHLANNIFDSLINDLNIKFKSNTLFYDLVFENEIFRIEKDKRIYQNYISDKNRILNNTIYADFETIEKYPTRVTNIKGRFILSKSNEIIGFIEEK